MPKTASKFNLKEHQSTISEKLIEVKQVPNLKLTWVCGARGNTVCTYRAKSDAMESENGVKELFQIKVLSDSSVWIIMYSSREESHSEWL